MRRVATVTVTAGILTLTATPANADTGFWRSAGLPRVDAFGVYRTNRATVRLNFLLKDLKKGRRSAAVRFTFTEPHHQNSVRVVALRSHGARKSWQTISSANTRHLYIQECLGTWHKKTFRTDHCGGWRRRY